MGTLDDKSFSWTGQKLRGEARKQVTGALNVNMRGTCSHIISALKPDMGFRVESVSLTIWLAIPLLAL